MRDAQTERDKRKYSSMKLARRRTLSSPQDVAATAANDAAAAAAAAARSVADGSVYGSLSRHESVRSTTYRDTGSLFRSKTMTGKPTYSLRRRGPVPQPQSSGYAYAPGKPGAVVSSGGSGGTVSGRGRKTFLQSVKGMFSFDRKGRKTVSSVIDVEEVDRLENEMLQSQVAESAAREYLFDEPSELGDLPQQQHRESDSYNPYLGFRQFSGEPRRQTGVEGDAGQQSAILIDRTNDSFGGESDSLYAISQVPPLEPRRLRQQQSQHQQQQKTNHSTSSYMSFIRRLQDRGSTATASATEDNNAPPAQKPRIANVKTVFPNYSKRRAPPVPSSQPAVVSTTSFYAAEEVTEIGRFRVPGEPSRASPSDQSRQDPTSRNVSSSTNTAWKLGSVRDKLYKLFSNSEASRETDGERSPQRARLRSVDRPLSEVFASCNVDDASRMRNDSREASDLLKVPAQEWRSSSLSENLYTPSPTWTINKPDSVTESSRAPLNANSSSSASEQPPGARDGTVRMSSSITSTTSKNPFLGMVAEQSTKVRKLSSFFPHYGIPTSRSTALSLTSEERAGASSVFTGTSGFSPDWDRASNKTSERPGAKVAVEDGDVTISKISFDSDLMRSTQSFANRESAAGALVSTEAAAMQSTTSETASDNNVLASVVMDPTYRDTARW
ncbi:hypothetical protein BZA70DRAFT_305091 [Myxozyma melibiosi]|uniref:Uncharacterized protein n=1 Tax=Myxozyma melibiosi TaxID=54550 RepID=A0ABR1F4W4_9ASCO